MKQILFRLLILTSICHKAASQNNNQQLFNESQYLQVSQGYDAQFGGKLYAVNYKNTQDSTYIMKKLYKDSSASQLVAKRFYKSGIPEGPFFHYTNNGDVSVKGRFKDGKLNGDRLTYQNGVVVQEAHFQNGRKKGAWKEYKQGQLKRTITYDNQENIQSVQATNQNQ